MTIHRFYAPTEAFHGDSVTLGENEAHHLRDVLRHSAGDEVQIFDGVGGEFLCRIDQISKRSTGLTVVAPVVAGPESPLKLTVAAAILKGEKFDLVIKKCVELGVSSIVPIITDRCDVRLNDAGRRLGRWQKLVVDASRQCGRATLAHVAEPLEFKLFIETGSSGPRVLFSERSGTTLSMQPPISEITAIVGPEGGWSDPELDLAHQRGLNVVTLGGRILRAETASITIATILQHRFGDIN